MANGNEDDMNRELPFTRSYIGILAEMHMQDLSKEERQAVLDIYRHKFNGGEFEGLIDDPNNPSKGICYTAHEYRSQKCAFEDVLSKKGYNSCQEVLKDYDGAIAFLTRHGTFGMLGKFTSHNISGGKKQFRRIEMKRIHTPRLNKNGHSGNLNFDLKIGNRIYLEIYRGNPYQSSNIRNLAINPNGGTLDELGEHEFDTLVDEIDLIGTRYAIGKFREEFPESVLVK
ncbi:hypothetical protein GOV12_00930 [Candidatus Pacearchaeota archaeon]|nr:hypothetical protein [Candidatus Pacearchaeota archaeon]